LKNLSEEVYEKFKAGGDLEKCLPGFEHREEQLKMAQGVSEAMCERKLLLVEAPTGIGKTIAYLVPALLSEITVVISTGTKNLQEQIYYRDIPAIMKALDIDVPICYIKGRSNYLCLRRFELTLPELKKLKGVKPFLTWASKTISGDREEIDSIPDSWKYWKEISSSKETCYGQKCPKFNDCFITILRKKAFVSRILVINHHLFFADLAVREISNGEVIPSYDAVILDEGHHIEKTASSYFGFEISNYKVDELQRDIRKTLKEQKIRSLKIDNALIKLEISALDFFIIFSAKNSISTLISKIMTSETCFSKFKSFYESIKNLGFVLLECADDEEELLSYVRRSEDLGATIEFIINAKDDSFVYWFEGRRKGIFLYASPIDISGKLSETLFKEDKPIIISSATLTTKGNFEYFKERIGIAKEKKQHEMICSSVFDYKKQAAFYIPRGLPEPRHHDFFNKSSELLLDLIKTTRGRALILCTSKKNMEDMYGRISPYLDFPCYIQGRRSKRAILSDFKENESSVLFATGSFWEGIDVPGGSLSCLVIDKLPFASPGEPRVEARINWLKKNGKNPFIEYQIPEAVISLRQGFGRLIRSRLDVGVFSIFDSRILNKYYGKIFIESLPECQQAVSVGDVGVFLEQKKTYR